MVERYILENPAKLPNLQKGDIWVFGLQQSRVLRCAAVVVDLYVSTYLSCDHVNPLRSENHVLEPSMIELR